MPSGLDGNPNPVVTPVRDAVLSQAAARVLRVGSERMLVGVDGRSGAGKSTFADELGVKLEAEGAQVLRSTTDSFHRPRSERMHRGPISSEGYYLDSHQLEVIRTELLEPFARGTSKVLIAAFDEPTDSPVHETADIDGDAVLIFDGLFLQRPELVQHWNLVIFLDADERTDARWLDFLLTDLPAGASDRAVIIDDRLERASWPRYRTGWTRYVDSISPADLATLAIDNNDFGQPWVTRASVRTDAKPNG